MRTTLNLDDDVLLAVRERARHEKRSAGEVLSDLARQALTRCDSREAEEFHGFVPFPPSGHIVTNELINKLREDGPY